MELAAELIHLGKREGRGTATITLASSSNGVLPRLPKRAGSFAEAWLRHRGVQILRARLEPLSTNSRGEQRFQDCADPTNVVSADLVFDCTGAKDNGATNALVQGGLCQADYLGKAGSIETLETLQLPNASHIFVAGDVGRVPNELDMNGLACEKTAYAAEECGLLAARNVMTLLRSRNERTGEEQISLHQYPKDVLPRGKFPRLFVISLFKYHAILCLGPVVVAGRLPSLIKVAIEFFGVLSAKSNSFVAQIFRFLERITYVLAVAFALVYTWFRGQNLI